MKRKSLLKRSLAVLLAAAMAVMGGHVEALLLPHPPNLRQKALLPRKKPLLPMLLQLRLRLALKRLSLTCTAMK